uniref:Nuclear envelope pore membrane protein POM 121 n=1 Tax=Catagonus wagneri TaxID=51154 RepID=A0A8C3YWK4_9CETA
MGGYLSRFRPCPLSSAARGGDLPERPQHLESAHPARRVHSGAPILHLTRKLLCEDLVASPRRSQYCRRFVIVHRRQYPVRQARGLFMGIFSSVPKSDYQKPRLSACSSKMFCTSAILKMASAKGKLTLRLALKQTVICMWSSLSVHFSNLCVKETVVKALEGSSQLRAKKEKPALVESGKGLATQKKGHSVLKNQDEQRRGSNRGGNSQSAFRRLMVNGVLSSFVPRPGPLKRDLCSKSSEDTLTRKSQTYSLSSSSKRNAITSSYSSTRGFPQLQRSSPGSARLLGPASLHLHVPAEKASEESHQSSPLASAEPQRKINHEKAADAPLGQKQNLNCSQPSDNSKPLKRKTPLLLPSRPNDPLILPPLPQLGYRVTAEHLDLEKRAAIQWINKVLEG